LRKFAKHRKRRPTQKCCSKFWRCLWDEDEDTHHALRLGLRCLLVGLSAGTIFQVVNFIWWLRARLLGLPANAVPGTMMRALDDMALKAFQNKEIDITWNHWLALFGGMMMSLQVMFLILHVLMVSLNVTKKAILHLTDMVMEAKNKHGRVNNVKEQCDEIGRNITALRSNLVAFWSGNTGCGSIMLVMVLFLMVVIQVCVLVLSKLRQVSFLEVFGSWAPLLICALLLAATLYQLAQITHMCRANASEADSLLAAVTTYADHLIWGAAIDEENRNCNCDDGHAEHGQRLHELVSRENAKLGVNLYGVLVVDFAWLFSILVKACAFGPGGYAALEFLVSHNFTASMPNGTTFDLVDVHCNR